MGRVAEREAGYVVSATTTALVPVRIRAILKRRAREKAVSVTLALD
jgi:hypothetical protein